MIGILVGTASIHQDANWAPVPTANLPLVEYGINVRPVRMWIACRTVCRDGTAPIVHTKAVLNWSRPSQAETRMLST